MTFFAQRVRSYRRRLVCERLPTRLLRALFTLLQLLSLRITFLWRRVLVGALALVVLLGLAVGIEAGKRADHLTTQIGIVKIEAGVAVEVVEVGSEVGVEGVHACWTLVQSAAAHGSGVALRSGGASGICKAGIAEGRVCARFLCRLRVESSEEEALLVGRQVRVELLLGLFGWLTGH